MDEWWYLVFRRAVMWLWSSHLGSVLATVACRSNVIGANEAVQQIGIGAARGEVLHPCIVRNG
ncbi:hypothetical protein CHX23_20570 [Rhodococcoides fascians]|nr:hypothetical protein ACG96_06920 [Rhodococcus fascians]OZC38446.1 hypothetical protein CHX23_20570 [Rhodococcus fascians]